MVLNGGKAAWGVDFEAIAMEYSKSFSRIAEQQGGKRRSKAGAQNNATKAPLKQPRPLP